MLHYKRWPMRRSDDIEEIADQIARERKAYLNGQYTLHSPSHFQQFMFCFAVACVPAIVFFVLWVFSQGGR